MTQGAGQEPVVRTATLRDFRVPPYARVPVQGHAAQATAVGDTPSAPAVERLSAEHPAPAGRQSTAERPAVAEHPVSATRLPTVAPSPVEAVRVPSPPAEPLPPASAPAPAPQPAAAAPQAPASEIGRAHV